MSEFHVSHRPLPASQVDYPAEIELARQRAAPGWPSAVRIGRTLFFSAANGDAWVLDVPTGQAARLALSGEPWPSPILAAPGRFAFAWHARHRFDDGNLTVIEDDGSTATHTDYPVGQIQSLIEDYPAESAELLIGAILAADERRRHTGRNDSCPCGSGRKYKKCCLPLDERSTSQASQSVSRAEAVAGPSPLAPDEAEEEDEDDDDLFDFTDEPDPPPDEPRLSPEVNAAADRIWDEIDRLVQPEATQLDALLDQLLALPPEATPWHEVLDVLAAKQHPDLASVFHHIHARIPPSKAAAASYFYWNAIEKFITRGQQDLVPVIAAGFCRLGREGYDPDALHHMVFWAMAAGQDEAALAMEEHFLPIIRSDSGLMPHAVPSTCRTIFELRVGLSLGTHTAPDEDVGTLARALRRDIDEEIHPDFAQRAAQVIRGAAPPAEIQPTDFDLPNDAVQEGHPSWQKALRQFEAVTQVALESWQIDDRPPASAFRGLWLLVDAVYDEAEDHRPKRPAPKNLLDCLHPRGMERRIARSTRDLLGTNPPHAHLLIEAHADLLRFAARHGLIGEREVTKSETNIATLRQKLGFATGRQR